MCTGCHKDSEERIVERAKEILKYRINYKTRIGMNLHMQLFEGHVSNYNDLYHVSILNKYHMFYLLYYLLLF